MVGRKLVALDIGSANLRAIQFTRSGGMPKVQKVARSPLPRGVVAAGEVRDAEALSAALKALWSEHKLRSKQVVFGVANNSVFVRQLELDWLAPAEFTNALKFRVADHIPMPVEATNLGYHVIGEYDAPTADGKGTRRMVRILLVVATSEMVSSFVEPIRAAGLMPVKLDVGPFALVRAAEPAASDAGARLRILADDRATGARAAEAVVDIGADVTTVVVHRGGQPRFVRILTGHGGNAVTDALVETFGWSPEDAERAKHDAAATASEAGRGARPDAGDVITRESGLTISEIRNSLDYFMSTTTDVSTLTRVVLTGGGAMLPGLESRLGDELRVPVHPGAPWQGMGISGRSARAAAEDAAGQTLAMAIGLAKGAL